MNNKLMRCNQDSFIDIVKSFYLRITDPIIIGHLKLEILTQIVTDTTAQNVADELFVSSGSLDYK